MEQLPHLVVMVARLAQQELAALVHLVQALEALALAVAAVAALLQVQVELAVKVDHRVMVVQMDQRVGIVEEQAEVLAQELLPILLFLKLQAVAAVAAGLAQQELLDLGK
jgi:hypothetical protein